MGNLADFYNNILAIEIIVFGIVSAAIFVFIQLIYSTFSYGNIKSIFKDGWLLLFGLFNITGLFLTASASLSLALDNHDFLPKLDLGSRTLVASQHWAGFSVLTLLLSIFFIAMFVLKNLSYLNPSRVLLLYAGSIKYKQIRDFIFKKFGVADPKQFELIAGQWRQALEPEGGHVEPTEDDIAQAEKELRRRVRKKERIERQIKDKTDPLIPVTSLIVSLIKKTDLKSLEEAVDLVCGLSQKFISSIPRGSGEWYPERDIPKNYTDYLIEHIETQLEVCSGEGFESAKLLLLNTSNCLAKSLLENKYFREIEGLAEFWKRTAGASLGESPQTFIQAINYYQQALDALFEMDQQEEAESIRGCIDDMFQDLGWLSEQVVLKLPFEERPWFPDYDYEDEFSSLFNCLMRYDSEYKKQSKPYPLIYFDALMVTLLRLSGRLSEAPTEVRVEKRLMIGAIESILSTFSSFAEWALENDNADGASLSAINISKSLDDFRKKGLNDLVGYATQLMFRLGDEYAKNKPGIVKESWLGDLGDWVIEELTKIHQPRVDSIREEIRHNYPFKIDINYIKKLGRLLNNNFGLMFNPQTGKDYPKDDPRRGR